MIRSLVTHICLAVALAAMPATFAPARAEPIVLEPPFPSVTYGTADQSFVQYTLGPVGGNSLPFTELPPNQYFMVTDYTGASDSAEARFGDRIFLSGLTAS
jgi:hypothetical protein